MGILGRKTAVADQRALVIIRKMLQLSQTQLAEASGVPVPVISELETKRKNPRRSELKAIAEVLGYEYPMETLLLPYHVWVQRYGGKAGEPYEEDDIVEPEFSVILED